MDDEPTLFRDQWATVTPSRVVVGGATYSVANIESVGVRELRGNLAIRVVGLLLLVLGAQFLTCTGCLIAVVGGQNPFILAGTFLVAGVAWLKWAPLMTTSRHAVCIGLGGRSRAIAHSPNQQWSSSFAAAIASALTRR